jgi:hypothetical protein
MRKVRKAKFGDAEDFAANWKWHLVRFSCEQFEKFKTIVHGRTEIAIIAEAVDVVMRGETN